MQAITTTTNYVQNKTPKNKQLPVRNMLMYKTIAVPTTKKSQNQKQKKKRKKKKFKVMIMRIKNLKAKMVIS